MMNRNVLIVNGPNNTPYSVATAQSNLIPLVPRTQTVASNLIPLRAPHRKATEPDFQRLGLPPIDHMAAGGGGHGLSGNGGGRRSGEGISSPASKRRANPPEEEKPSSRSSRSRASGGGSGSLRGGTLERSAMSSASSSARSNRSAASNSNSETEGLSRAERLKRHKKKVKPWWIGQRIVCETEQREKLSATIKDYVAATGSVQLWYDNEESTFETVQLDKLLNWTVADTLKISEYPALNGPKRKKKGRKSEYGTDSLPKYKIIDFIPRKHEWRPMEIEMCQRVKVLYRDDQWYTAFIDGFDPISRRHHVNYGDTAEWLWATPQRIKPIRFKIADHAEVLRSQIESKQQFAKPPPWDPEPYGLDERFERWSRKMVRHREGDEDWLEEAEPTPSPSSNEDEEETVDPMAGGRARKLKGHGMMTRKHVRSKQKKRKKVTSVAVVNSPKKKRKMTRKHPVHSLPTTPTTTGFAPNTAIGVNSMVGSGQHGVNGMMMMHSESSHPTNRSRIGLNVFGPSLSSPLRTHSSKSGHRRSKRSEHLQRDLHRDLQQTTVHQTPSILMNGGHHSLLSHSHSQSHSQSHTQSHSHSHRRPMVTPQPSKPPPPRHRLMAKYPRKVMIGGQQWTRCHSKEEKKYFWTLDDGTNTISAWDPWSESGENAPWVRSLGGRRWNKFKDDDGRPYWYDYQTKESTYDRPIDYESEELIEYDSDPNAAIDS